MNTLSTAFAFMHFLVDTKFIASAFQNPSLSKLVCIVYIICGRKSIRPPPDAEPRLAVFAVAQKLPAGRLPDGLG